MSRLARRAVWSAAALLIASPGRAWAAGDVFDQFFRYTEKEHKAFFEGTPEETVDPFTGTLRIVHTDLVLPGKAGLDLRVVRAYSSKIWGRADLLDAEPLLAEKERSVLGYGWTSHMGRLKNPNATGQSATCSGDFPIYEAPDGTARVFYPAPGSNTVFLSKDYWRMEKSCAALGGAGACVWSSNGVRYEFSNNFYNQFFVGTVPVWPASGIVDPHGNRIAIAYVQDQSGAIDTITDTYGRTIGFGYSPPPAGTSDWKRLATITFNQKTIAFGYTSYTSAQTGGTGRYALPGARRFLTSVTPPAGPAYQYAYNATTATVTPSRTIHRRVVRSFSNSTRTRRITAGPSSGVPRGAPTKRRVWPAAR